MQRVRSGTMTSFLSLHASLFNTVKKTACFLEAVVFHALYILQGCALKEVCRQ
jgi:hypothetical protein